MSDVTWTLIALSDPHLEEHPGPADAALDRALGLLAAASDVRPAAILLTGDLSEDGSEASYRRIAAATAPVVARGARRIVVPGNHDDVDALRRELLDGGAVDRVVDLGGARVVALDSTVPGAHHGALTDEQLDWLTAVLRDPAPSGSVVVLHHPPLPFADPVLDGLGLREPGRLAAALAGSDVRLVVCGHAHQLTAGTLAGVPVWCAPALRISTDGLPPAGRARSMAGGGGLTRIELRADAATATFVPDLQHATLRYDESRADRLAMLRALAAGGPAR